MRGKIQIQVFISMIKTFKNHETPPSHSLSPNIIP